MVVFLFVFVSLVFIVSSTPSQYHRLYPLIITTIIIIVITIIIIITTIIIITITIVIIITTITAD